MFTRTEHHTRNYDVASPVEAAECHHCGNECVDDVAGDDGKHFCCGGCHAVFLILRDNGLERFYELKDKTATDRLREVDGRRFEYLDDLETAGKLLDFSNGKVSRITLHVPSIHCVACVWLLENLYRIVPGVGVSSVNFGRREVAITFNPSQVSLRRLVERLAGMGYEPEFRMDSLEGGRSNRKIDPLYIRLGVAGFAFGNIMFFSLPTYLGLSAASEPGFHRLFAAFIARRRLCGDGLLEGGCRCSP